MSVVNEIKCARCDRKYSGVRSRCPYCGARRIGRGKYTEDSENAKGKMLIGVLILAVFAVGATILLFSTPTDADALGDDPALIEDEDDPDDLLNLIQESPTPTPTFEPEPVAPPNVTSIAIWVPNSHRVEDFTMSKDTTIELTALLEPVGIENEFDVIWESTDEAIFDFVPVVGGIRVQALETGDAKLIATAGDQSATTWVRVR